MLDHDDEAPVGPDFALWVRSRRVAEMLTQEQLAERAGLSVRTVRNLETGRGGPPRLPTRRLVIAALSGSNQDLGSRTAAVDRNRRPRRSPRGADG